MNNNLATLLSFGSKDDVVTLFPALDNQSFTGEDMRCEASIDLSKSLRIIRAILFLDNSSAVAIAAQSVKDRCLKATHLRHLRVHMKGVSVIAETVKESLILLGRL